MIVALTHAIGAFEVAAAECPQVAGWIEPVVVAGRMVEAKLDTGAQTSSISARDIVFIERDGRRWVRFRTGLGREEAGAEAPRLSDEDKDGVVVEAPVVREARVRRAGAPTERRPVVSLPMCLAGVTFDAEFSLTDREALDYQVLIGRSALGRLAIDPQRTHLTRGTCRISDVADTVR